jgi:predicted flap endonuclease-1-like 5' DNA nuclease
MFYDIASFAWWLLAVALAGLLVGWVTYADTARRSWFEGWAIWGAVAFVVGLVVAVLKLLPGEAGLWLEIALLVMFLYVVGCLFGGWLKSMWLRRARQRAEAAARSVVLKASALVEADASASQVAARTETERAAAAQAEQDRLAAEAAVKVEAEHRAAAARAEQDRSAAEAAAKVEAERLAATAQAEQDRLAAEVATKAEAEARAAAAQAEQGRLAAEAAAKVEAEHRAAAAQAEQDRLAAEAAAKAEAERRAAAVQAKRERLAAEAAAENAEADRLAAAVKAEQDRLMPEANATADAAIAVAAAGIRPSALPAPQGAADDLKLIKGIGPNNERTLNDLGIYHFSQISDWSKDHASWIGHEMAFPGRIERESWIPQAKLLAAGFDTDHSAGVKSGVIKIDDSADALMSEAEADAFDAGMPGLMPAVEGEERHAGARPLGLAAPRGIADDLKRIKGIGKQNETRLKGLGIWHFEQIAAWSAENVKWVGSYLAFAGRIDRERWIAQAKDLAAGRKAGFARHTEASSVAPSLDNGSRGHEPNGG